MKSIYTWDEVTKMLFMNTHMIEQEYLDDTDRSVAMDELVPVVKRDVVISLLYGIANGGVTILPPKP